jgi:cytochrome c-type biogenesis protein CcmH/NrfF
MTLDLRIPLGLMFTLVGVILTLFGLKTNGNSVLYAPSLGINVNLWWGLVMLAFGVTMFLLGRRGQKRLEQQSSSKPEKEHHRRGH